MLHNITEEDRLILDDIKQTLTNQFAQKFVNSVTRANGFTDKQLTLYAQLKAQLARAYQRAEQEQQEPEEQAVEEQGFDFSELDNFEFKLDEDDWFK